MFCWYNAEKIDIKKWAGRINYLPAYEQFLDKYQIQEISKESDIGNVLRKIYLPDKMPQVNRLFANEINFKDEKKKEYVTYSTYMNEEEMTKFLQSEEFQDFLDFHDLLFDFEILGKEYNFHDFQSNLLVMYKKEDSSKKKHDFLFLKQVLKY